MLDISENELNKAPMVIEVDPDKRYCIEIPHPLSMREIFALKKRWQEFMVSERDVMILDGGAKLSRMPVADDSDHHPDA